MTEPSMTTPGGMTCDEVTELSGLFVLDALRAGRASRGGGSPRDMSRGARRGARHGRSGACAGFARSTGRCSARAEVARDGRLRRRRGGGPAHRAGCCCARRHASRPRCPAATPPASECHRYPRRHRSMCRIAPPGGCRRGLDGRLQSPPFSFSRWSACGRWASNPRSTKPTSVRRCCPTPSRLTRAPDSQTAVLDDPNSSAAGFAAVTADGTAYVVLSDLPPAPSGMTYQGWYIVDNAPVSAGLVTVGPDGLMLMTDSQPAAGTSAVAFTLEPAGGSEQPTSQPFVVGELQSA